MHKYLMYNTGEMFTEHQTGGAKRFEELTKYLFSKGVADLCCQDSPAKLEENGLHAAYEFREREKTGLMKLLPPEAARLVTNWSLLKQMKRANYENVVSFDVPPTIGLCLLGFRNVILMIRKDMIGYSTVTAEGKIGWKHRLKMFYMWACESICLKKAKKIVVQCEYDKQQLLNRHSWIAAKVEGKFCVQINNVNPSWIVKKSAAVAPADCPTDQFRVCFVGNFNDSRKGHDILLEAASALQKAGCDIRFEIIGAGRDLEHYRNAYESENIVFHGRLDNPMTMLKSCDLMVVPSRADSCPNTVMESLYNGIAVIGSRVGGIPDILQDPESMFALDAMSLAQCIEKLYKTPQAMETLRARQSARKEELMFDWAQRIYEIIG